VTWLLENPESINILVEGLSPPELTSFSRRSGVILRESLGTSSKSAGLELDTIVSKSMGKRGDLYEIVEGNCIGHTTNVASSTDLR
jgi:hypothetical protein